MRSEHEWRLFDRLQSNYVDKNDRFILPHRNFQRQYAHIYAARLWALRPKLHAAVQRQFGPEVSICRCL